MVGPRGWASGSVGKALANGGYVPNRFQKGCSLVGKRQTQLRVGVSAVQATLARRIYDKLHATGHEELLTMSRMMALMPEHELAGRREFELRGKLN